MKGLLFLTVCMVCCFEAVGQDQWFEVSKEDSLKLRQLEVQIDSCYKTQLALTDSVIKLINRTGSDTKIKAIKLLGKLNNPNSVAFILKNYEFVVFPRTNYEECCFPYADVITEYVKSNLFLQSYKSTLDRNIISITDFEKLKWIHYFHTSALQSYTHKPAYNTLEKLILLDGNRRNDYLLKYDSITSKTEENLLLGLSDQSQLIRDSCAVMIKKILVSGENLVKKDNIVENYKSFWDEYTRTLMDYNTVDECFKKNKLRILKRSTLDGDSIYQVDNTYALVVKTDPKSKKIEAAQCIERIDYKNVEPSLSYTGIWRNYFINGAVNSSMSYENGVLAGSCYQYYPNGALKTSSYYQNNTLIELREYNQEGLLILKR